MSDDDLVNSEDEGELESFVHSRTDDPLEQFQQLPDEEDIMLPPTVDCPILPSDPVPSPSSIPSPSDVDEDDSLHSLPS
jgi:hypothetical protein